MYRNLTVAAEVFQLVIVLLTQIGKWILSTEIDIIIFLDSLRDNQYWQC